MTLFVDLDSFDFLVLLRSDIRVVSDNSWGTLVFTTKSILEHFLFVVVVQFREVDEFFLLESDLDGFEMLSLVTDFAKFEWITNKTLFWNISSHFDVEPRELEAIVVHFVLDCQKGFEGELADVDGVLIGFILDKTDHFIDHFVLFDSF